MPLQESKLYHVLLESRILIGSLSSPKLAIRTPKMDNSQTSFVELLFEKKKEKRNQSPFYIFFQTTA